MRQDFPGYIRFNDVPYCDRVSIFASALGLHFGPGHSNLRPRSIGINPMPAASLVPGAQLRQSGFFFNIQGTSIGACSELAGHPADGEFRVWSILEFMLAAKYADGWLTLGLTGRTQCSHMNHMGGTVERPKTEFFPPLTFRLEVRVPQGSVADAFQLGEAERRSLSEE